MIDRTATICVINNYVGHRRIDRPIVATSFYCAKDRFRVSSIVASITGWAKKHVKCLSEKRVSIDQRLVLALVQNVLATGHDDEIERETHTQYIKTIYIVSA